MYSSSCFLALSLQTWDYRSMPPSLFQASLLPNLLRGKGVEEKTEWGLSLLFHVTMSDMSNWLVWETNQCRKDNVRASWLPCSSYFSVWSKFYLWRKPWPPWVVSLFIAKRGPSTCAVWASLNTPWSQSPGIHCLGRSTALSATVWQGRWTHMANIFTMTMFVPLSHQMSIPRCTFKDKIK